jgi:hypothetical protein
MSWASELAAQTYTFSNIAPVYSNTGVALDPPAMPSHGILQSYRTESLARRLVRHRRSPVSRHPDLVGNADGLGARARYHAARALQNSRATALTAHLFVA